MASTNTAASPASGDGAEKGSASEGSTAAATTTTTTNVGAATGIQDNSLLVFAPLATFRGIVVLMFVSRSGEVDWDATTAHEEPHTAGEGGTQGNLENPLHNCKQQDIDMLAIGAQFEGIQEVE